MYVLHRSVGVEILNHCIKPPETGRDSQHVLNFTNGTGGYARWGRRVGACPRAEDRWPGGVGDPSAQRTQGPERAAIADPGARKAPVPEPRLEARPSVGTGRPGRTGRPSRRARNGTEARTCRAMPRHSVVKGSRIAMPHVHVLWHRGHSVDNHR